MRILDGLKNSSDLKNLSIEQLKNLSKEIREEILSVVSNNGGHLSSNLGIVETTIALYYVFDFPQDKLVFDVGHQCYAHKLLSDRRDRFISIRLDGGLSGFQDAMESEYDPFSTGHAGTSIAVGLGLCSARDKLNNSEYVINVVGDGALVNGLNLEALSSSQEKPKKYIVILNDNGMSISKNKNGLYRFICRETTKKGYINSKKRLKKVFGENSFITRILKGIRDFFKHIFGAVNIFDKFGFKYIGVIDGNNITDLINVFKRIKEFSNTKAVFLHLTTTKGKGVPCAEERSDLYHGVGKELKQSEGTFSTTLGEKINSLIEKDNKIVAITAGMKDGTGLAEIEKKHPNNFYDVGIAEEFAVTYAAGMAKGGLKPIVCIYSTFLQRAYDQIIHDVCIQNLPVVFCLDRAGVVGSDGKTHQGVFDISYLSHIPNMTILAPANESELKGALDYALTLKSPVAIRYPKNGEQLEIKEQKFNNKWQTIVKGEDIAILAVGPKMLKLAIDYQRESKRDIEIISARVIKPLDTKCLDKLQEKDVITLEENSEIGGFGSLVLRYRQENNCSKKTIINGIKDKFIKHGKIENQLKDNELTIDKLIGESNEK